MGDLNIGQTSAEDVYISGTAIITGSVAVTSSTVLGISGIALAGSFAISSYNNWTGIGSVFIGSQPFIPVAVSGINLAGSFALSNPWAGVGSILVSNTVPITNALDEEGRRSPGFGFSGALLTASGLTTNIFIPIAGSKALLKSYTISSDVANYVSIKFSGLTTIPVTQFFIPASGTAIQNFIGCEPSGGADMPVSAGVGVAGNIYVSVFVRSIP